MTAKAKRLLTAVETAAPEADRRKAPYLAKRPPSVQLVDKNHWMVESLSRARTYYAVKFLGARGWGCVCKAWIFGYDRATSTHKECKHILIVKAARRAKAVA